MLNMLRRPKEHIHVTNISEGMGIRGVGVDWEVGPILKHLRF